MWREIYEKIKRPIKEENPEVQSKIVTSKDEGVQEIVKETAREIDATEKEAKSLVEKINKDIAILALKGAAELTYQPKLIEAKRLLENIFIQNNEDYKRSELKKLVACLAPAKTDEATKIFASEYLAPTLGLIKLKKAEVVNPDDFNIEDAVAQARLPILKERAHQALYEVVHNEKNRGKEEFLRYIQEKEPKAKLLRLAQVIAIGENLITDQPAQIKRQMLTNNSPEKINFSDPKNMNRLAKIFGINYEVPIAENASTEKVENTVV